MHLNLLVVSHFWCPLLPVGAVNFRLSSLTIQRWRKKEGKWSTILRITVLGGLCECYSIGWFAINCDLLVFFVVDFWAALVMFDFWFLTFDFRCRASGRAALKVLLPKRPIKNRPSPIKIWFLDFADCNVLRNCPEDVNPDPQIYLGRSRYPRQLEGTRVFVFDAKKFWRSQLAFVIAATQSVIFRNRCICCFGACIP